MKHLLSLFIMLLPLDLLAANWVVEAEADGKVVWSKDSVADIHAPGGLTLWNKQLLHDDVVIEYEARIMSDGRVSDLNCFWMASDPTAKDVFVKLKERGGKFLNSYALQMYYVGYGGNHNATTRFRRYDGDRRGIDSPEHRPAILREYLDKENMIVGDHWYKIRLEVKGGHVRYIIDGKCLVDFVDPKPLTKGYFGFRTTLSHAQFRNYKATCTSHSADAIVLYDVNGSGRKNGFIGALPKPTTLGIPFAQGELQANALLSLTDGNGNVLTSDQWTLATWPDGSVKWKAMAAVVPADAGGIQVNKQAIKTKKVAEKGKTAAAKSSKNGAMAQQMQVFPSASDNILDSITIAGKRVCGAVWMEQNGKKQPVTKVTQEQQGGIRSTWRFDGKDFCVRLYAYKGSNEIKIVHTEFIDSMTNADGLHSLSIKAEVPLQSDLHQRQVLFLTDSTRIQTMDVKPLVARRPIELDENGQPKDAMSRSILSQIAAWDGFRLSQLSPNGFSIRKRATEQSPWIGTIEGQRAPGVVAVGDKTGSMAFHLDDFWQSYPSTIQVDKSHSGNALVSLYLWSKEAEAMNFAHYDTIPHGLNAAYEDIQEGMSTANGIARTSVVYLYPTLTSVDSLAKVLPLLAEHAQYLPLPKYLHDKRAFGYWSLDNGTALDTLLYNIKDFYVQQQEEHGWYGYFNYGDFMHSYDVSRGEWRYDVGGYAWDNTELGTPAMLWYQFLRTGDKDTYRLATAMTRHCAEVDCYHRGPHAGLGTRHNVLHWGCGAKEARISQAFWNRFMYYLTADERLGDLMREVVDADQLLYELDPMRLAQPRSARYPCTAPARLRIGPDWLAYAGNWFTEWERTGNTKYRDKILAGMKSIAELPRGIFSGPKALGYDPATGIITWEGDSTVMNTNHLLTIMGGFEIMNEMMLSLSTPQWKKTWLEHAVNYKENALKISKNVFRIPRLQGYGYWFTGSETLKKIAFEDMMKNNPMRMLQGSESINTIPMTSKGGFYTNDAATFTLDAIFLQEVAR